MAALLGLETILPFLFVLAVVYGSLEVSKVFENRKVKALIAAVMAFFSISSPGVTEFILFIIPYALVFFVIFFFLGFVLSALREEGGKKKPDYVLMLIVLGLAAVLLSSGEYLKVITIEDENFIGMVVLLVIALILLAAYRLKEGSGGSPE